MLHNPLDDLPEEILWDVILSKLYLLDKTSFDLTSTTYYQQSLQHANKFFGNDFVVWHSNVNELLRFIARGGRVNVRRFIQDDPSLLYARGYALDLHGRKILDVTPLQLAFGGDDVGTANFLLQQLIIYFIRLGQPYKWLEVINKQLLAKFSDDKPKDYDFSDIVLSISTTNRVAERLLKFRNDFKPSTITKGKHFPIRILINACKIYMNHFDEWDHDQRDYFWQKVIGFLQKVLPAIYIRLLCTGLGAVSREEGVQDTLSLANNNFYQFQDTFPTLLLGYNAAIYTRVLREHGSKNAAACIIIMLEKYIEDSLSVMNNWLITPLKSDSLENALQTIAIPDKANVHAFQQYIETLIETKQQLTVIQAMIKAFYLYEEKNRDWHDEQRNLFNNEVLGYLEKFNLSWLREELNRSRDALTITIRPSV